jgi:hypothetical protein
MPERRQRVNWEAIAAHLLHPRKVEIIESLAYIGQPLSSTDLLDVLKVAGETSTLQQINHHVVHLEAHGVLAVFEGDVEAEGMHGNAHRVYYTFASEVLR